MILTFHGPDRESLTWIVEPATGDVGKWVLEAWCWKRVVLETNGGGVDTVLERYPRASDLVQFWPPSGAPSPVPIWTMA